MASTHSPIILLVLICIPNALSSVEVTKAVEDEKNYLSKIYTEIDESFKNLLSENLKSVLRVLTEKNEEVNLSTKCKANALKLLSGLRRLDLWAVNFIDATGKLSDGFLNGNFHMMGNYEHCLNSSVLKRSGEVDFRGQYCSINYRPPLPKPEIIPDVKDQFQLVRRITLNLTDVIRLYIVKSQLMLGRPDMFGLCVPSGCKESDVQQLIKYVGKQTHMDFKVDYCETVDDFIYFTPLRIVFTCIYSLLALILFIGSAIDQYSKAKKIKFENPIIRTLLCFSVVTNFPKFMNTKVTETNLSCFNGIRVLSLFYVILGHHYLLKADSYMMLNGFSTYLVWLGEFFFQIVTNGIYTVDVFFFIGGFLNCYIRAKKNFTYFSLPTACMALVHRLFRLYPVLISSFILLFLLDYRGPVSHNIYTRYQEPCFSKWWESMLFVNNFPGDVQCFAQTWYLACDMQFFLVSLISIPLLLRKPKIGIWVNLAIIFFSILATAVRVYVNKMPPSIVFSRYLNEGNVQDFHSIFQSPFTHSASYFGGALLGFYIIKKKNVKIPKIAQFFGWIIASTLFCTVLFITQKWNSGGNWTRLGSAIYFSLSRPIYSWSVGWLILCCVTGHGGVINYILSLKMWIPLNRLGLTMYLFSPIMQMYFFGNLKTPMDTQRDIEIWGYFGDTVVCLLVSLPFVLLFESPFIALEKIIFHTKMNAFDAKENTSDLKGSEMNGKTITQNDIGIRSDKDQNSIKV